MDAPGLHELKPGDFVRVAKGLDAFRGGHDGMVVSTPDANGDLGLVFAYDRHGDAVQFFSEGTELWNVRELEEGSAER